MVNLEYTFGFMDYAAFVVIVAIYFILVLHINTRVNNNIDENQLECNSEWNMREQQETFLTVALSNIIKYSSWMILLGICSDAYENGIQFLIFFAVGSTFMTIFMNFIIIPVFHESEVSTLNEYFDQRFDYTAMTIFTSVTSIVSHIFFIALSIYATTLVLWKVINVNFFILASTLLTIILIVFIVLDKRIRTNTFAHVISILMTCGFIVSILIKGAIDFGGFMAIWKTNWMNGNIKMPDLAFNPNIRETLWSLMISGCFWMTAFNLHNNVLSNWMKLKEKEDIRKSMTVYITGTSIITFLCVFIGMLGYAEIQKSTITRDKELFAHLFIENFDHISITVIFIIIIFSLTSYNNVSCELKTIVGIVNENIRKVFHIDLNRKDVTIMRLTAIIAGISSILLIPLLENSASSLLELTVSIPFTFVGSTFGILIIGIMIPWIGKRATFYGAIIAIFMMIYYVLMAEIDFHERKFTSNSTEIHLKLYERTATQLNYVSSYYYLPSSVLLTCINAFILSFMFGFQKSFCVNPKNFAPFIRNFISHHQIIENASSETNLVQDDCFYQ